MLGISYKEDTVFFSDKLTTKQGLGRVDRKRERVSMHKLNIQPT